MEKFIKPRVYIACLSSYNAGVLHGSWVTVPDNVEDLQNAIYEILRSSSEQPAEESEQLAEEWAVHDYENFGPFEINEYESLENIVKFANVCNEIDDFTALSYWDYDYLDIEKLNSDEIIDAFHDDFLGCHNSEDDFAYDTLMECYDVPEQLRYYIDPAAFWRDLTCDGYYSHRHGYCECYVYRTHN